jgi:hypothetical protein
MFIIVNGGTACLRRIFDKHVMNLSEWLTKKESVLKSTPLYKMPEAREKLYPKDASKNPPNSANFDITILSTLLLKGVGDELNKGLFKIVEEFRKKRNNLYPHLPACCIKNEDYDNYVQELRRLLVDQVANLGYDPVESKYFTRPTSLSGAEVRNLKQEFQEMMGKDRIDTLELTEEMQNTRAEIKLIGAKLDNMNTLMRDALISRGPISDASGFDTDQLKTDVDLSLFSGEEKVDQKHDAASCTAIGKETAEKRKMQEQEVHEIQPQLPPNFPRCYKVTNTPSDGNCLFSAIAHQLGRPTNACDTVRREIVQYITDNSSEMIEARNWNALLADEGGLQTYLSKMACSGTYGDGIVIEAASVLYKRPIEIILSVDMGEEVGHTPIHIGPPSDETPLTLGYCSTGGKFNISAARNHYVSLTKISVEEENEDNGIEADEFLHSIKLCDSDASDLESRNEMNESQQLNSNGSANLPEELPKKDTGLEQMASPEPDPTAVSDLKCAA